VTTAAAQLDLWLVGAIDQADDGGRGIAEIWRSVALAAERGGRTRPSYERVRTRVHELRDRKVMPSTTEVLLDVALRLRPPDAVVEHLAGTSPPRRLAPYPASMPK